MTGRFLANLVLSLIAAFAVAACVLFLAYAARPPEAEVLVNGDPARHNVNLDQALVVVELRVPRSDDTLSAALYLHGIEFEVVEFRTDAVAFPAFVVPSGNSTFAVETRRTIGPFIFRDRKEMRVRAWQGTPVKPVVSAPAVSWGSHVEVSGTGQPGSRLTFLLDDKPYAPDDTGLSKNDVYVDYRGRFRTRLDLKEPGEHTIRAVSETRDASETPLVSDEVRVLFKAVLPPLIERRLSIEIGPRDLKWSVRAKFRPRDPRLKALATGDAAKKAFLEAVFGDIHFNGTRYSGLAFHNLRIRTYQDQVWIEADSLTSSSGLTGTSRLDVVHRRASNDKADLDALEIKSSGPALTGYLPPPKRVLRNTALWTGEAAARGSVSVFLEPVETPLTLRSLSPSHLLPAMLESLIDKLVVLIPVFWLLLLSRRGVFGPSSTFSGLSGDVVLLGVLGCFTTLQYLVRDVENGLNRLISMVLHEWLLTIAASTLVAILLLYVAFRLAVTSVKAVRPGGVVSESAEMIGRVVLAGLVWGIPLHAVYLVALLIRKVSYEQMILLGLAGFVLTWLICSAIAFSLLVHGNQRIRRLIGTPDRAGRFFWLVVICVVLFLCYPQFHEWAPVSEKFWRQYSSLVFSVFGFMSRIGSIAPLAAMALACVALHAIGRLRNKDQSRQVALMLFAAALVGPSGVWFVFPVPLLIALLIFPLLVWGDERRARTLAANRSVIYQDRAVLLEKAGQNASNHGAGGGWFGLGLFGLKEEEKKKLNSHKELAVKLPNGEKMSASQLVFAFGPRSWASDNAWAALKVGFWGSLAFVFVYALPTFVQQREGDDFPYLWALIRVFSVGAYWLIGAFFLGYFFETLRGTTGWKKGAWLAFAITLAIEPMNFFFAQTSVDYAAIAVSSIQRFAFFMLVGFFAFDLATFRALKTDKTGWDVFPRLTGLSVMQASLSLVIAGAGVTLTSVFTGQVTTVLAQVAAALIPVINTIQPVAQAAGS